MGTEISRRTDGYVVALLSGTVDRLIVDHRLSLDIVSERDGRVSVVISGSCTFQRQGVAHEVAVESDSSTVGPLLTLRGARLQDLRISADGTLDADFGDEGSLTVSPDPEYEAWELTGDEGPHVVCTPGGELAIWR